MSWNVSGPRYYYNDPSGSPYHDPAWYRGNKDDDKDNQREEIFAPIEQEAFNLSNEEMIFSFESGLKIK